MSEANSKKFTKAVAALEIDDASKLLFSGLLLYLRGLAAVLGRGYVLRCARLTLCASSFPGMGASVARFSPAAIVDMAATLIRVRQW